VIAFGVRDRTHPTRAPVGDVVETVPTREAAERFVADCAGGEPEPCTCSRSSRSRLDGDALN
jgi:hypothetical protein